MRNDQESTPDSALWSTEPTTHSAKPPTDRMPPSDTLLPPSQPLAGPGAEPGTQYPSMGDSFSSPWMVLRAIAIALVGFLLTAGLLHSFIRKPLYLHADYRSGKLRILSEWRGRAFSAAFGSSHVHNGFDPRVFDQALAGTALATHSLNLAIAGGSQTEQRAMALEFLHQLQAPPLHSRATCLVLLELTAGANFANEHLMHPRAINIYDLETDRFVYGLTSPQIPLRQRWGRIGFALTASLYHYINLGMLSSRLFPPLVMDTAYDKEVQDDRRGALLMDPSPEVQHYLEAHFAQPRQRMPPLPGLLFPGNISLIEELQGATTVKNVHYAYVVMPKVADYAQGETFPASLNVHGQLVPIVNLAQPDRFPEIYRPANWLDDAHLNTRGAAVASTLVAEFLEAFYAAHPGPMGCGS